MFAISATCATRTARAYGGVTANLLRLLLATVLLGVWAHGFGTGMGGAAFPWFLLSGVVGFGIGDVALFQALLRLGPRRTMVMVQCLAAPVAAISEWVWLGTTLRPIELGCGAIILAGVGFALLPTRDGAVLKSLRIGGVLFGLCATAGQAWGAVISRKAYLVAAAAGQSMDGVTAAYQRILAGVLVAFACFGLVRIVTAWHRFDRPVQGKAGMAKWVVANALAGPVLGVACYQWALQTAPSGIVLAIVATTPLAVMPLARWLEGERITQHALAGSLLAVAGAVALTLLRH